MANILLQYFRETKGYSNSKVAGHLAITENEYLEIEDGTTLLTEKQTIQLGNLFKTKPAYFLREAVQQELLHFRADFIKVLKAQIIHLEEKKPSKTFRQTG